MRKFKWIIAVALMLSLVSCGEDLGMEINKSRKVVGKAIDSFNGVEVYYNDGGVHGRHRAPDGYNLGLKWQCVEFVKRYYYEVYNHKMPNPWGHAKHYFKPSLPDGAFNKARGLYQYRNPGKKKPEVGDIVVFNYGRYGHVAIVSRTGKDFVEVIQQNVGTRTRDRFPLTKQRNGLWKIGNSFVSGWLSIKKK